MTVDELLVEIATKPPPMTTARFELKSRADAEMELKYPDRFAAYFDRWAGDVLTRRVILTAAGWDDFLAELDRLPDELRIAVDRYYPPDPNREVVDCPSVWIIDEDFEAVPDLAGEGTFAICELGLDLPSSGE